MKKLYTILLVLAGCTQTTEPGVLVKSNKPRLEQLTSVDTSDLANSQNQFAFDLYQELRASDDNILFSPYSISTALLMVYAGAKGQTATEMAKTLHLPNNSNLYAASNKLDHVLTSQASYQLSTANSLFADTLFQSELKAPFLDILSENYGAGVHVLDFVNQTEMARQSINDWVAKETQQKILDLIPPKALSAVPSIVIVNAIYLKANWANPFLNHHTDDATFHGTQDSDIRMMRQENTYDYVETDELQAIELPYDGNQLAMVVILPKNNLSDLEPKLNASYFNNIVTKFDTKNIILSLPKFTFDQVLMLNDVLYSLGITQAFDDRLANFTGIVNNPQYPLYIGNVHHAAFLKVDEEGTEAAAATSIELPSATAVMPDETINMTVNKPFMFVIRDRQTGILLFVGRVLKL